MLIGGPSDNLLDASGFSGNALLQGLEGNDTLRGGSGHDLLEGGPGNDDTDGGDGDDTYLYAGDEDLGRDTVTDSGSSLGDTLDFFGLGSAVDIDLSFAGLQEVSPHVSLTLTNPDAIENLTGTVFSDRLLGNSANNRISGGGGLDYVYGADGDDYLTATRTRTVFLEFDQETESGDIQYTAEERELIQQRMEQDFAAFDVLITQQRPTEGVYVTVLFNSKPTVRGRSISGGAADRIGYRDVIRGGIVQVDINDFISNPNNRIQRDPQNVVALSSTIASHEIGHQIFGLRHRDAFGVPGSGIFSELPASRFGPEFTGPKLANETRNHLIASPASVRTTLADALANPFFGEVEAFKMAFNESGISVSEVEQKSGSLLVGGELHEVQELGPLTPVHVPNTVEFGANAGLPIRAAAHNVVGQIELEEGTLPPPPDEGPLDFFRELPRSESDFYSFSAEAGDRVNVEIYSFGLRTRLDNTIDSVLRVYDDSGSLLPYHGSPLGAFNDDGFEPTDSVIIDLPIPQSGTYYVEVDTFYFFIPEFPGYAPAGFDPFDFCEARVGDIRCDDTDTGDYELLIFTVEAGTPDPAGVDQLIGGPGADTLVSSAGRDLFIADQFDLFAGPGAPEVLVLNSPPTLAAIVTQTVDDGAPLTFTAQGSDADLAQGDELTYTLEPAAGGVLPNGATIDAATGVFQWDATPAGQYQVDVVVTDLSGVSARQTVTIDVVGAAEPLVIDQIIVNDGGPQRSNIETITIVFNQETNVPELIANGTIPQAVQLFGVTQIPLDVTRYQYSASTNTLVIDLSVDGFGGSEETLLADGYYQLRLDTQIITDTAGGLLTDDDLVDDAIRTFDFHRLLADWDGDATVNATDRTSFFGHYGSSTGDGNYNAGFDLDSDGDVDRVDYVLWRLRLGTSL